MKKNTRTILLAMFLPVAVLLVLAGAGCGVYYWMQSNKEAEAAATAEAKAKLPKFVYLQMPELKVPAAQGGVGQVELTISLEVYYSQQEAVTQAETRLADAFVSDLFAYLGEGNKIAPGRIENLDKIKARLVAVANRELGTGMVNDVLIQPVTHFWEETSTRKKDKSKEEE